MKGKIIVLTALVLSIAAFALMRYEPAASAQRNRTYLHDSGVIKLGPNQELVRLLIPSGLVSFGESNAG